MCWKDKSLHGSIGIGVKSGETAGGGLKVQHERPGLFPVQEERCGDARWMEEELLFQTLNMS